MGPNSVSLAIYAVYRFDPATNQWSCDVAPTSTCRTSVGVAVLDGFLYAVGGQDGINCLDVVERCGFTFIQFIISISIFL